MGWQIVSSTCGKNSKDIVVLLHDGDRKIIASYPHVLMKVNPLEEEGILPRPEWNSDPVKAILERPAVLAEKRGLLENLKAETVIHGRNKDGTMDVERVDETGSYRVYCSMLSPPDEIVQDVALEVPTASYDELVYEKPLKSWRMMCSKASLASSPGQEYVYKGLSFYKFLVVGAEQFRHEVEACYREIRMIHHTIPRHPHVVAPADYLIYAPGTEKLVCGSMFKFFPRGSLTDVLDLSREEERKIPVEVKAKWCFQLCSAMFHVHRNAGTYHQDLKPPNVLVTDGDDLVVVDWEQSGAAPFVTAPEADGSVDVREEDGGNLVYIPHEGPPREKHPIGGAIEVFGEWSRGCARAVELAEVYGMGKTMWVLLEQVPLTPGKDVTDYSSQTVHWSSWSEDVPGEWREMVERMIAEDPNGRPDLGECLAFWEEEWEKMQVLN